MTVDPDWTTILGHVQTVIVLVFLILGYVTQFIAGFRRDRGFMNHVPSGPQPGDDDFHYFRFKKYIDTGEVVFTYIIPATLHLFGFLSAVFVYRIIDNEQIQSLVERVFILSNNPRQLIVKFWVYISCGLTWLCCSALYIYYVSQQQETMVKNSYVHVDEEDEGYITTILYIGLFFQDLVQVVTILSYSIICSLLRCYLNFLKDKLILRGIEPLDWMREICEFRKVLHHLNTKLAVPVCAFTVLNMSFTLSSIVRMFKDMDTCPVQIFSLSLANILLWITLTLVPFVQAASVTVACRATQSCGHLVSIRPFVHRNTASEDLNTVLLYASSLKMNAKLFRMPINVNYLCFVLLSIVIVILTFGMCINISLGIY